MFSSQILLIKSVTSVSEIVASNAWSSSNFWKLNSLPKEIDIFSRWISSSKLDHISLFEIKQNFNKFALVCSMREKRFNIPDVQERIKWLFWIVHHKNGKPWRQVRPEQAGHLCPGARASPPESSKNLNLKNLEQVKKSSIYSNLIMQVYFKYKEFMTSNKKRRFKELLEDYLSAGAKEVEMVNSNEERRFVRFFSVWLETSTFKIYALLSEICCGMNIRIRRGSSVREEQWDRLEFDNVKLIYSLTEIRFSILETNVSNPINETYPNRGSSAYWEMSILSKNQRNPRKLGSWSNAVDTAHLHNMNRW